MDLLTRQENRIARLVAEELAEKEIADKLFIAASTVHTHTKNIRKKLGAKNNVGIATRWLLSLENPKAFMPTVFFLMLQLHMVFTVQDFEVRLVRSARKIVRVKKYEA